MSSILYYSNYCDHSKRILQTLAKSNVQDVHFICIDKREKNGKGKVFIVLENGQKIVMPENVTRVPALLLLNKGYEVLYGDAILQQLKPRQEMAVKQATMNNMEPMAFAFGGGGAFGSTVVSDQYSFLDQDLETRGNGGVRQMHNYVDLNHVDHFQAIPQDEAETKNSGRIGNISIEQLQTQREQEFQSIKAAQAPSPFAPRSGPPQQMQQMQPQYGGGQPQYNGGQYNQGQQQYRR
jgi:hypothetical protein